MLGKICLLPQADAFLEKCCGIEGIKYLKLIQWVHTCWGSMYSLTDWVLALRKVSQLLDSHNDWTQMIFWFRDLISSLWVLIGVRLSQNWRGRSTATIPFQRKSGTISNSSIRFFGWVVSIVIDAILHLWCHSRSLLVPNNRFLVRQSQCSGRPVLY